MTRTIQTSNVCTAFPQVFDLLMATGVEHTSRNGPVVALPAPLVIDYQRPWERVLVNPWRDANPFFHFFEALWMLAGRNDVGFPSMFARRIMDYSDDGSTLYGAYGYRWRKFFGDQLTDLLSLLREHGDTRRGVLGMYAPHEDLSRLSKDIPCNTHIYFDTQDGTLNMTVCNRSNDVVWGMLGANYVHFTVLQQFLAETLHVPMGRYTHFSNNVHVYTDVYPKDKWAKVSMLFQPEESMLFMNEPKHAFSFGDPKGSSWELRQIEAFIDGIMNKRCPIKDIYGMGMLEDVAKPMFNAWWYRRSAPNMSLGWVKMVHHGQWRQAAHEWLHRRWTRRKAKGVEEKANV